MGSYSQDGSLGLAHTETQEIICPISFNLCISMRMWSPNYINHIEFYVIVVGGIF